MENMPSRSDLDIAMSEVSAAEAIGSDWRNGLPLWNPGENCWMGWERKRGKLAQFNRLLRGDQSTGFGVQQGNLSILPSIKYVITLDADTVLPKGAAARLVATVGAGVP